MSHVRGSLPRRRRLIAGTVDRTKHQLQLHFLQQTPRILDPPGRQRGACRGQLWQRWRRRHTRSWICRRQRNRLLGGGRPGRQLAQPRKDRLRRVLLLTWWRGLRQRRRRRRWFQRRQLLRRRSGWFGSVRPGPTRLCFRHLWFCRLGAGHLGPARRFVWCRCGRNLTTRNGARRNGAGRCKFIPVGDRNRRRHGCPRLIRQNRLGLRSYSLGGRSLRSCSLRCYRLAGRSLRGRSLGCYSLRGRSLRGCSSLRGRSLRGCSLGCYSLRSYSLRGCSLRRHGSGDVGLPREQLWRIRRRGLASRGHRRLLLGGQFILQPRHLLLQTRRSFGLRVAIRVRRLLGVRRVDQRIPLLTRLVQIDSRLAVKREDQQKQPGYRCHSRYGTTHFAPPKVVALLESCGVRRADTIKVIVFIAA
jgi:hypothetical protein